MTPNFQVKGVSPRKAHLKPPSKSIAGAGFELGLPNLKLLVPWLLYHRWNETGGKYRFSGNFGGANISLPLPPFLPLSCQ